MAGQIVVWVAFVASIASAWWYRQAATNNKRASRWAQRSFSLMAASVLVASALLFFYILQHRYEYGYVWGYSSNDLPVSLLVTTFWAGQEGSFLYWALCASAVGLVLQSFARRKKIEYETMAVFVSMQSILLLLLAAKSPFQKLWETYPNQFTPATVPLDGKGLNPLLQNFWMIIHPPVLFLGFALMTVPFSLAASALWKRTFGTWIPSALPWVLAAAVALGAGIMLGGYWAYGVLGWGGWWGWDPVENSSLIPWIVAVILLHTMLVQLKTGKLVRTNLVLALVGFLLVVHSTFLTRSGILGEASVHSFVDPGRFVYVLLVAWLAVGAVGSGWLLWKRWAEIPAPALSKSPLISRESAVLLAVLVLGLSTLVVLFGTNLPLFGASTVDAAFYEQTILPLGVLLALTLGASLLLRWGFYEMKELRKATMASVVISLVAGAALRFAGLGDWKMLALACAAVFALVVSVRHAWNIGMERARWLGGAIGHIGMMLVIVGIAGSGFGNRKQTVSLPLGAAKEVDGYRLTYAGAHATHDNKWQMDVKVEKGQSSFVLSPVMFESKYNNSVMRTPDYASSVTRDVYIEPVSVEAEEPDVHAGLATAATIVKGQTVSVGGMDITFVRFDMGKHGQEQMQEGGKSFSVGAVLTVKRNSGVEQIVPAIIYRNGGATEMTTALLKGSSIGIQLTSMNVGMGGGPSTIQISVSGVNGTAPAQRKPDTLVAEISVKPLIGLIWAGSVIALAGLGLAGVTRARNGSLLPAVSARINVGKDAPTVAPQAAAPVTEVHQET